MLCFLDVFPVPLKANAVIGFMCMIGSGSFTTQHKEMNVFVFNAELEMGNVNGEVGGGKSFLPICSFLPLFWYIKCKAFGVGNAYWSPSGLCRPWLV